MPTNTTTGEITVDSAGFECSTETGELTKAILQVMEAVKSLPKKGKHKNYDYVAESDLKAAIRPYLIINGLRFSWSVTDDRFAEIGKSGSGTPLFLTTVLLRWRITHISGQWEEGTMIGQGSDYGGDKGSNKAITAAVKYTCLENFFFPTGDDPEGDSAGDENVGRGPRKLLSEYDNYMCAKCGDKHIMKDDPIYWDDTTKQVWHKDCHKGTK